MYGRSISSRPGNAHPHASAHGRSLTHVHTAPPTPHSDPAAHLYTQPYSQRHPYVHPHPNPLTNVHSNGRTHGRQQRVG